MLKYLLKKLNNYYFYSMKISILLAVFSATLPAQDINDIKTGENYYWGEAKASTSEQAKSSALRDLISKIQVSIQSEFSLKQQEVNQHFSEQTYSDIKTYSNMTLRGVKYNSTSINESYLVLAYISKENYKKSVDLITEEIREIVNIAEENEKKLGLHKVVLNYYQAYLKSFNCPEPVSYRSSITEKNYYNVRPFLQAKIELFLSAIDVKIDDLHLDAQENLVTIPVSLTVLGNTVNNVFLSLKEDDNLNNVVTGGGATLYLYEMPSNIIEEYEIIVGMHLDENTSSKELITSHKANPLKTFKKIKVDYSPFIVLDFSVQNLSSGKLLFKPLIKNLTISNISWDFGDGQASEQESPLHQYNKDKIYTVKMTLNNYKELTIIKKIDKNGIITKTQNSNVLTKKTDIAVSQPIIIKDLLNNTDAKNFGSKLDLLKHKHKLIYGGKDDFVNPENCYVFIINPKTNRITTCLSKGPKRKSLINSQPILNLEGLFKGMVAVYVEVL